MNKEDFERAAKELLSVKGRSPEEEALHRLEFLDSLACTKYAPIDQTTVQQCSRVLVFLFFGWLVEAGRNQAPEMLAGMVQGLFEHLYLVNRGRRATLASATKPLLKEFIQLVEFVVSEKKWQQGVNPFDGILLFYRYLDSIGYKGANVPRREKAIAELRRTMPKQPCRSMQRGYEMVQ